jgi:prevent-host-death family protein
MQTVTAVEARKRLSLLLHFAERGEEVVITRRGKPVARLLAVKPRETVQHAPGSGGDSEAVARIREFRKGVTLGGISIRELIDDGRK